MNDHVATEDAAREARTAPGLDAVPVDHAFEHRAALDHAAVADDQRADELRLGLDEAARADEHGLLDAHARIDLRPRADPHAGLDLASRHVELDAAEQRVEVAEPVLLDVADVVPVALESPAVKRCVGSQQSREDVARPVDEDAGGYIVEDRRLEGVNAAVAEIGERVGGGGFLLEARDTGRGVVDDDAVERWVVDLLHGQGRDAPVAPVSRHKGREVDVGEPVAADHDEGAAAEELAEGAGAARRTQQFPLEVVAQVDAEGGAVAEVRADLVRVIVQVGGGLADAVPVQEMEQVLHHRPVEDGNHGFGRASRERIEPRAQTGGHDVGAQRGGGRACCRPGGAHDPHSPVAQAVASDCSNGARSTPASVTMAAMLAAGVTSKAGWSVSYTHLTLPT